MKMILVKWLFFLLAIPAIKGSLKLWKTKDSSVEGRITKEILETCYGNNNFKDLIFIIGDFNEFFDEASVIRMNNLTDVDEDYELVLNLNYDYEFHQNSSIGVTKVLIIENSPEKLHSDLISFQKTTWWNHMLPFIIIGKNDEKCENFMEMLNITWEMDIINSIYICSKSENTSLYTLNPITNYAPDPWKRMEVLNDLNIYHQIFHSHTSCKNLNYDKTKVLNGYQIKAVKPLYTRVLSLEDLISMLCKFPNHRLFYFVIRQLNASLVYEQFPIEYFGEQWHLNKGDSDVGHIETRAIDANSTIRYFFPIGGRNDYVVVYKTRYAWNTHVLYGAVTALIILFFILAIKNGEVTSAILDLIRFFTYASIRADTRSNSFRIYFTTMLIFLVISNGVFQGQIAAFLTTLDKVPPIKTIEELVDSGYQFHISRSLYLQMPWSLFRSNVTSVHDDDDDACINYVSNSTLNACILPFQLYQKKHRLKPLDSVRSSVKYARSGRWKSRRNWPLYERFNYMLMRVIESGINTNWRKEDSYCPKLKSDDHALTPPAIKPPWRPIELVNLDFAFKLLAAGLSLAMFVLIIELRMREI